MPTLDATVAGANSNSYETLDEANIYFDERLPLPVPWVTSGDDAIRALIQSTRTLDMMAVSHKTMKIGQDGGQYIYISKAWTGAPATTTQRLAWPRTGMYDRNGNPIPSDVIPRELKEAESELAGQLKMQDTTLDNAVAVGGITSAHAGSVSVTFRDDIMAHVLPDAVLNLMPASWFTEEVIEPAMMAEFDVVPMVKDLQYPYGEL
jgi:hypothetical protein